MEGSGYSIFYGAFPQIFLIMIAFLKPR